MEGAEKPQQDSSLITEQSELKPLETASQVVAATTLTMKQHEGNDMPNRTCSTTKEAAGQRIDCVSSEVSLASDERQPIPSAVSVSNATPGLEGQSVFQPAPLAIAVSCSIFPSSSMSITCTVPASATDATSLDLFPHKNNSQGGDSCDGQGLVASSCVLPSSTALASDGGRAQPITSVAVVPAVPSASSALESGFVVCGQAEKPLKKEKIRKRPRQLLQHVHARDVNKSTEKQPVIRWKDVWVAQLIHIRGRMHSTFTSPQRQRVDLWQIVKHEMTNSCYGFDKDSEACRKKWIRVYKEYKDDLHLSNDKKSQKCKFYDLVDFYMGNRAGGANSMPMLQEPMPVCPDLTYGSKELMVLPPTNEVEVKVEDGGAMVPHASSYALNTEHSPKPPPAKRPHMIDRLPSLEKPPPFQEAPVAATSKKPHIKSSVQTMLSELVNIGKELLQTTREFEKEKLAVLHSIKDTLGKIAKKI